MMRKKGRFFLFLTVLLNMGLITLPVFLKAQMAKPVETTVQSAPEPGTAVEPNPASLNSQSEQLPGVTVLDSIQQSTWLQPVETEKTHLSLVAGRSHILRFVKKIMRISVSDPEVLDVAILSPTEVLLNAKKQGAINIIAWDFEDRVSVFDVTVTRDPTMLLELLKQFDPTGHFEVFPSEQVFVIKGETDSVEKASKIEKAANAFAEGSVSLVHVKDAKQILLQIRFVQIDRTQNYEFGLDIEHDTDNKRNNVFQRFLMGDTDAETSGDSASAFITPTTAFNIFDRNDSDLYQLRISSNKDEFFAYLKALETKGIVKTIARPNLLAKDGEEASFLVGGEAAVLVQTSNNISVEYKEFGNRLKFKPEIVGDGVIRLTVEPEVSSLNSAAGVNTGDTQVPGFSTTKAKTVVELKNEETLVIGGLIQQKMTSTETGVPFLRRIPGLGRLFESTDQEWTDNELIVIVTPSFMHSEKEPVVDKAHQHDILSTATQLVDNPIPNDHADAIVRYFQEHKRYIEGPIDIPGGMDEKSASSVQTVDLKTLDALEAKLQKR